ncbi:urate hydroxylase PuuD [Rhodobacter sp. Har01]|uniref:urate hydroxylase PuuD n=1 Tax=Rhodobacter sp. Har01 TaxID=2883999 RepID=UPI001D0922F7|nr:urate hydroxylase PuuD [Rhodobacter sp. Har01]MCB6179115.1 urate hydroxylase PuuD [Rhodobacter sp. Har01]
MTDWVVIWEWVTIAARWLHVITAMAWIGSSFYFIALDLGLRQTASLPPLAYGEEWQVHGGGFYHVNKYLVAPDAMPDHLTWFKWESYGTWLSGFVMLVLVYYLGAELFLIDPTVMDLAIWQAVAISMASLAFGWIVYDAICRVFVNANQTAVMLALFGVLVGMSWFYTQVFSGRAAMLHLGAFTASIMSGNVFFTIMPNQRIVVADLKAGRKPDAKYGQIAKQRSMHNNYLTLPVIFLMLSNHYPLVFATPWNWLIASLVFLMGVSIRHWFNQRHARKGNPHWTWALTVVLFLLIAWLSTVPMRTEPEPEARLAGPALVYAAAPGFAEVVGIVQGRCSMCHAAVPSWEGVHAAPKGVLLETEAQIAREAWRIYLQAGLSHAMPPGNRSFIEPGERAQIVDWFRAAGSGDPV